MRIAEEITKALPGVKRGSLRFWGNWFGRPYDNSHLIVSCKAVGDSLVLVFDQGETLTVKSPRRLALTQTKFKIRNADSLKLEWYSYGEPRIASSLCMLEIRNAEGQVPEPSGENLQRPSLLAKLLYPAIEIL
jgi:hypothetical protein